MAESKIHMRTEPFISVTTSTVTGCISPKPYAYPFECEYLYIAEKQSEILDCEGFMDWQKEVASGDETTFGDMFGDMKERYYHRLCTLNAAQKIELFGSEKYNIIAIYPDYDEQGKKRTVGSAPVPAAVGLFDPMESGHVYVASSAMHELAYRMGTYSAIRAPFSRYVVRSERGQPVFQLCALLPDSGYGLGEFYESCFELNRIVPDKEHDELLELQRRSDRLFLQLGK